MEASSQLMDHVRRHCVSAIGAVLAQTCKLIDSLEDNHWLTGYPKGQRNLAQAVATKKPEARLRTLFTGYLDDTWRRPGRS